MKQQIGSSLDGHPDVTHRRRVVGLDLSLASAGMSDGETHKVAQTSSDDCIEYRLNRVVRSVMAFVEDAGFVHTKADLVVIESGAYSRGAQSQAAEVLSALRFMVRYHLWLEGVPFAMVGPTTLKRYTTGSGTATKTQMVNAVHERHGVDLRNVKVKDGRYDMADAFALAAMGYAHLNRHLPTEGPPAPLASLLSVKWPEGVK